MKKTVKILVGLILLIGFVSVTSVISPVDDPTDPHGDPGDPGNGTTPGVTYGGGPSYIYSTNPDIVGSIESINDGGLNAHFLNFN